MEFLDISFLDYQIPKLDDTEFLEFCRDVDLLGEIGDPEFTFFERKVDNGRGMKHSMGTIIQNTKDTTKTVAGIYGGATDVGGQGIKSIWDLFMAAVSLIGRVLKWIFLKIYEIPKMIMDLINGIGNIPANIKAKIRGDIKLYITAEDLMEFYNSIFLNYSNFIVDAHKLSQGDTWNTFFGVLQHASLKDVKKLIFSKTDLKIIKRMDDNYDVLKKVEFEKSIVELKNDDIINIYFGNAEVIEFTDITGKHHKMTYYDGLIYLIRDLQKYKKDLEELYKSVGEKINRSQANSTFAELSPGVRNRIVNSVTMISKVINITGNLVRYILIDMKTIENATTKLLKKGKILAGDVTVSKPEDIDTKHIPKYNKNI